MLRMDWVRHVAPWVFVSFGVLACGGKKRPDVLDRGPTVPNPDVPQERLPQTTDRFVETACPFPLGGRVIQCGVVTLPLTPGSEESVKIAVARAFTDSAMPKSDPVVYLEGGPGSPSLSSVPFLFDAFSAMAPDRDFIFFDQRGVGQSRPNLGCSESGPDDQAISACFARLSDETDLNAFNTVENARDVDGLRRALGYSQWNLLGISYGTRLALTVMRDHPEGVRASVLDSVVPLQEDFLGQVGIHGYESFLATFEACAAQSDCAESYPDPLGQLTTLVAELNDEPVDVGGFPLDGDTVVLVIFNLLYSPTTLGFVPLLIDTMAGGDFSLFEELEPVAGSGGLSFGMHLSLHCSEELPFSTEESFDEFDAGVDPVLRPGLSGKNYLDYCRFWPVEVAADRENEPVKSDLPTLVLSGRFDPITPPNYAELVAGDLSASQLIVLESESHGVSPGDCGSRMVRAFLDSPSEKVDASCVDSTPGIEFFGQGRPAEHPRRVEFATALPSEERVEELLQDLRLRLR